MRKSAARQIEVSLVVSKRLIVNAYKIVAELNFPLWLALILLFLLLLGFDIRRQLIDLVRPGGNVYRRF